MIVFIVEKVNLLQVSIFVVLFFFFSYLLLELRVWHGNDFGKIVLKKWLLYL